MILAGVGSVTPPAAPAHATTASTVSRLSTVVQSSTSVLACASAIGLGVKSAKRACVRIITWMVSENTMQAAVLVGVLRISHGADGLVEGGGAGQVGNGQIDEYQAGHEHLSRSSYLRLMAHPSYKRQQ